MKEINKKDEDLQRTTAKALLYTLEEPQEKKDNPIDHDNKVDHEKKDNLLNVGIILKTNHSNNSNKEFTPTFPNIKRNVEREREREGKC